MAATATPGHEANAWMFLQPSIQGIIHPGGDGSVPDALVIGFAFGATL